MTDAKSKSAIADRLAQEAKSRIVKALNRAGVPSTTRDTVSELRVRAKRVFGMPLGGEDTTEYFNRIADTRPRTTATTGQIVPPQDFNLMRRPELRTSRIPGGNPRADSVLRSKGQVSMASKVKEYVGFEAWW